MLPLQVIVFLSGRLLEKAGFLNLAIRCGLWFGKLRGMRPIASFTVLYLGRLGKRCRSSCLQCVGLGKSGSVSPGLEYHAVSNRTMEVVEIVEVTRTQRGKVFFEAVVGQSLAG